MNALSMLSDWRREVQKTLLPELHGHQSKVMADLSFAMTVAQHCQSGKLAVATPGHAKPVSVKRRLQRYLANDRIDLETTWSELARAILAGWAGGPIVLILDETPNHNDLRCLKVTLAYRKRAVPLGCVCYALGEQPEPMPELVVSLLRRVAACVPPGVAVTLLADRGLAWPDIVDTCRELGWHYVLRLLSQTRVRTPEGRECSVAELAPRPGTYWRGAALVFKKARWRAAAVAACWLRDCDGPWLLVSDRDDGPRLFRRYSKRVWTEELFRDEKSSGFHWGESHVTDPVHAARLVLLIALATYLALAVGTKVIKAGLRQFLESTHQRMLSFFTIGLRWVMFCLTHDRSLPKNLTPVPI
jgi:Transposase DDE domain